LLQRSLTSSYFIPQTYLFDLPFSRIEEPSSESKTFNVEGGLGEVPKRARKDQLWVKVAVSLIGPSIVMETGLLVPEKEPEPLPVQLLKL
jgi:hypothetical protein